MAHTIMLGHEEVEEAIRDYVRKKYNKEVVQADDRCKNTDDPPEQKALGPRIFPHYRWQRGKDQNDVVFWLDVMVTPEGLRPEDGGV